MLLLSLLVPPDVLFMQSFQFTPMKLSLLDGLLPSKLLDLSGFGDGLLFGDCPRQYIVIVAVPCLADLFLNRAGRLSGRYSNSWLGWCGFNTHMLDGI